MTFILPTVFFSGFIFPRETLSWFFHAIGTLLPATYFIELMRAIVLRGAGLAESWANLAVLAAMGAALFLMCVFRFQRRITD
jgi:ABC-2 type transport system permease protein